MQKRGVVILIKTTEKLMKNINAATEMKGKLILTNLTKSAAFFR